MTRTEVAVHVCSSVAPEGLYMFSVVKRSVKSRWKRMSATAFAGAKAWAGSEAAKRAMLTRKANIQVYLRESNNYSSCREYQIAFLRARKSVMSICGLALRQFARGLFRAMRVGRPRLKIALKQNPDRVRENVGAAQPFEAEDRAINSYA